MLAVATGAQIVLFLALIRVKTMSYMIALWPLAALCLAWLAVWVWNRRPSAWVRLTLILLLCLLVIEGGARVVHARGSARATTSYEWFENQVSLCIPPGSLVLGLQHYWLGLHQYPYRTWLMPLNLAHPRYYHDPLTFDDALERINPDIMLVDRYIGAMLDQAENPDHPNHRYFTGFQAFLARRGVEGVCAIRDRTYGTMLVYRVPAKP